MRTKLGLEEARSQIDGFVDNIAKLSEELENCPNAGLAPILEKGNQLLKQSEHDLNLFKVAADAAKGQLARLLPKAKGHALEPWAAYWELRVRLDQASEAEIQQFLAFLGAQAVGVGADHHGEHAPWSARG